MPNSKQNELMGNNKFPETATKGEKGEKSIKLMKQETSK